ncbi:MAG: DNA-3-methyladenine glycosylase 2 family protein [Chloroflexi bacterium]|nr:DNA-3-methyladenine glycosylase 2 family protein [Chloroflexota bacterium]
MTLGPLAHGAGDPTLRFDRHGIWRATRTPLGPATIRLSVVGRAIDAEAWGPGAAWLLEGLPAFLGAEDEPSALRPTQPLLRALAGRLRGLRFSRTRVVVEALVPAVIEQKVTGTEARRAYRALIARYGEAAPGPVDLRLPPTPQTLGALPYHAYHPLGLEKRRADTLRRIGRHADLLEEAAALGPALADARLQLIPGVGPWTSAEVRRTALGDPDALSVGDYHVPNLVAWALAGEARGSDARMLELLEPYRGQRARVVRLLEASGLRPPRFGPRMMPRSIAAI